MYLDLRKQDLLCCLVAHLTGWRIGTCNSSVSRLPSALPFRSCRETCQRSYPSVRSKPVKMETRAYLLLVIKSKWTTVGTFATGSHDSGHWSSASLNSHPLLSSSDEKKDMSVRERRACPRTFDFLAANSGRDCTLKPERIGTREKDVSTLRSGKRPRPAKHSSPRDPSFHR